MWIITHRKIFFSISGLLVAASIVAIAVFGLRLGIDFTGGSLLEVQYPNGAPDSHAIEEKLASTLESLSVQGGSGNVVTLRFRHIPEDVHQQTLETLRSFGDLEEQRFDTVGPTIGAELKKSGVAAIGLGLLAIMIYIAWAFRRASRPVSSWQYGIITAGVALFHDVLIPLGAFAVFGKTFAMEVNTPFIAAILTVLGYSVHDTIIVFDRIRENLRRFAGDPFPDIVGRSVRQTFGRSLNTSLTVLFAIAAVWYFGGAAIQPFAITLFIGIVAGTYSSIFVASTMLVAVQEKLRKRRQ